MLEEEAEVLEGEGAGEGVAQVWEKVTIALPAGATVVSTRMAAVGALHPAGGVGATTVGVPKTPSAMSPLELVHT